MVASKRQPRNAIYAAQAQKSGKDRPRNQSRTRQCPMPSRKLSFAVDLLQPTPANSRMPDMDTESAKTELHEERMFGPRLRPPSHRSATRFPSLKRGDGRLVGSVEESKDGQWLRSASTRIAEAQPTDEHVGRTARALWRQFIWSLANLRGRTMSHMV